MFNNFHYNLVRDYSFLNHVHVYAHNIFSKFQVDIHLGDMTASGQQEYMAMVEPSPSTTPQFDTHISTSF